MYQPFPAPFAVHVIGQKTSDGCGSIHCEHCGARQEIIAPMEDAIRDFIRAHFYCEAPAVTA